MFNKNKKPIDSRTFKQLVNENLGVVKNKNAAMPERNRKEDSQGKLNMRSEGGRN